MTAANKRDVSHILRVVGDVERTAPAGFLVTETLAVASSTAVGAASRVAVEPIPDGSDRRVDAVVAGVDSGVALLELAEPIPGASPARLVEAQPVWGEHVDILGFPAGIDTGTWVRSTVRSADASGGIQLDPEPGEYPLDDGFVGTAVRDTGGGVLGMVADSAGVLIPTRTLLTVIARLSGRPGLGELATPPSPFRGLAAYEEFDSTVFHARNHDIATVVELLRDHRSVSLVGDSGCGKSSLIRAGVIPVLRAQGYAISVIPGSAQETEPNAGDDLLTRVQRRLAAHADARHLIFLDQIEEILATPDGEEALKLVASADVPPTARIVLAMRPDGLGTLLGDERYSQFTRPDSVYTLSPLDTAGQRIVLTTAERATPVTYEDGLVELILRDVATTSTPMPLLGYLMEQLWDRGRDASRQPEERFVLTHADYHKLGGVTGAIGLRAEQIWESLDDSEKTHARGLLRRLVDIPDAEAVPVRRPVSRSDVDPARWRVAQRLATGRLLSIGGDAGGQFVTIVHEILFREWDRYARWIDDDRAFLLWRTGLARDVSRWESHDYDVALLSLDAGLAEAEAWERAYPGELDHKEQEYLTAGRASKRRRLRGGRWRRTGLGAVAASAVVLAALGGVGLVDARKNSTIADSHRLVRTAQELEITDAPLSIMTALAAYQVAPTREARNQLMRMYWEFSYTDRAISTIGEGAQSVYSRDGDVFIESADYAVNLYTDVLSGTLKRHRIQLDKPVWHIALAANGTRAVVFHADGSGVWFDIDPAHGMATDSMRRIHPPAVPRDSGGFLGDSPFWSVAVTPAMSADGRYVTAYPSGHVAMWDLATGRSAATTRPIPSDDRLISELWHGKTATTPLAEITTDENDQRVRLISVDVETSTVRDITPDVDELEVSRDGAIVVTCREQGGSVSIERRRTGDGKRIGEPYITNSEYGCGGSLELTPSGRLLYLEAELIDLARGAVIARPNLPVSDGIFENGGKLYGRSAAGNTATYTEIPRSGDDGRDSLYSAISGDGKRFYSVLADGRLLSQSMESETYGDELAATKRLAPYWPFEGADHIEFNDAGTRLLLREGRNIVTVRDAKTLDLITSIKTRPPQVYEPPSELFGPADPGPSTTAPQTSDFTYQFNGDDVVTVSDTVVQRWNANTGQESARLDIARFRHGNKDEMWAGHGPRPGTIAVIAYARPGVSIVDLNSGAVVDTIDTPPNTIAAQFGGNGRYMALLRSGTILELWRTDPLTRVVGPLRSIAEGSNVSTVTGFVGDEGKYVLGAGNTLSVYDAEAGGLIDSYYFGNPITDAGNGAFGGAAENLSHVIRIDPSGSGGPIALDPAVWQKHLCKALGGRDFTEEELATLPGDLERGRICA